MSIRDRGGEVSFRCGQFLRVAPSAALKNKYRPDCYSKCTFTVKNSSTQFFGFEFNMAYTNSVFSELLISHSIFENWIHFKSLDLTFFGRLLSQLFLKVEKQECNDPNRYIPPHEIDFLKFVVENVSSEEACQTLDLIRNSGGCSCIEVACVSCIVNDTTAVFASKRFLKCQPLTLVTILEQDHLLVRSEIEIFSACLKWAKANAKPGANLREMLEPTMGLIRFRSMSVEDIENVVRPSQILTPNEEKSILNCIKTGSEDDMPDGFSISTISRRGLGEREIITFDLRSQELTSNCATTGNWNWEFDIDEVCYIYGVTIKACRACDESYKENLVVVLATVDVPKRPMKYVTGTFVGEVKPGDYFDIMFQVPFKYESGRCFMQFCYSDVEAEYTYMDMHRCECDTYIYLMDYYEPTMTHLDKIYISRQLFDWCGK